MGACGAAGGSSSTRAAFERDADGTARGGVLVPDPSATQLDAMQPGDVILIEPPRSKTDQFGEIHCPFPSTVPFTRDILVMPRCAKQAKQKRDRKTS